MRKMFTAIIVILLLLSMSNVMVEAAVKERVSKAAGITPSGINYRDIGEKIESFVAERQAGLASMEVAVFDNSETLYEGYFGYSDIENKIKADESTVYEWGSSSKLFVWISVMQLYEQGKLDLEVDIRKYLPEGFLTRIKYSKPITMLNLMSHTAGFQEIDEECETSDEARVRDIETVLRESQPIQIYEPGTVTSYSNWGCTLAAFIVQCVSGENYTDYVHENILDPLGMEHTAVSADYSDNIWVKEQRNKLKAYSVMQGFYESFGKRISYIELYPAGSATGTLKDFTKLAKAFVPEAGDKCSLFEHEGTLGKMLSATTYYGNSDIPRNCHGLWTLQFSVDVMGHSGNTKSCSSQLMFDPRSGIGIAVLANEENESAFSYGLLSLIFGSYLDNERAKGTDFSESLDISGVYAGSRTTYTEGCMRIFTFTFLTPIMRTENPNLFRLLGEETITKVQDHQYLYDDANGFQYMMYETINSQGNLVLESYTIDQIKHSIWNYIAIVLMLLATLVSIFILIVRLIRLCIRICRKKKGEGSVHKKSFILQEAMFSLAGLLLLAYISVVTGGTVYVSDAMLICFCGGFIIIGIISLVNAVAIALGTLKSRRLKKQNLLKSIFTVVGGLFIFGFIVYFQLYKFWSV